MPVGASRRFLLLFVLVAIQFVSKHIFAADALVILDEKIPVLNSRWTYIDEDNTVAGKKFHGWGVPSPDYS